MCFRLLLSVLFIPALLRAEPIRVQGAQTVAQVLALAAPVLKKELAIELKINPEGGSSGGISAVGSELADVGMSTRAITGADRSLYPEKRLVEELVGTQALALIVPADVWDAGVRSLTKAQAVAIYEGDTRNWKPLGGGDVALKYFNPARGHGVWEFFVTWLYGDIRKAPLGKNFDLVADGRDARNSVEFNAGSLSVAAPRWADSKSAFALGVKDEAGAVIEPTIENIQNGRYPITRPLYLISGDKPTGQIKKFFDFMLSPRGQELVKKAEFIGVKDPKPAE